MHPGRPKSHPGSSSSQCPPRSLSWGRAAPPEHPGSSTHTEPILSGPEPSLGPEPKLKQDLLCRGLSFGPSPEECQEMMPALLWQRPQSPVAGREGWSWAQSPQHPLSCRSWAPLAGTGGGSRCWWGHLAFLPGIQRLWEDPARCWASPPNRIPLGVRAPG